ncbi:UDP-glucosyltransferase 29-like [Actinidia eriantha]|uniref:UDP-glucosyltransferase 29-like n=1 Tax=Actinidia eriantha TaxID=165200 RepID=UPI00258B7108|nr:UDP-glucosyltransferase 29-like [Actinidia eriantha]
MDSKGCNMSVLMQPWLAYGHISPFLELAKKLIERDFHIYFCSTPHNLNLIKKKLNQNHLLSLQLIELHLPSLPDLPPHHHTTNGLPTHLMSTLKTAFNRASSSFSEILKTLKPDLVIYDQNQPWAPEIASSYNIPAVYFSTFGAAVVSFAFHMLKNSGEAFPYPEIHFHNFRSSMIRVPREPSGDNFKRDDQCFLDSVKQSCDIVLIKTFREIEGKYIDYFSALSGKKLVPVGPLIEEQSTNEDENIEIMKWLDMKKESSTVFVSFGSECFLTKEEIEEVAHGLEFSGVNFIWVVRFPMGERVRVDEVLPKGFLERVGEERGLVVEGWAPQAKILGHASIGGFVSHCGWNSVLESMSFGVPIIALPMQLDQPLNARLVEEVGVGVEVTRDESGGLQREEIAQGITLVVVEKNGEGVRTKARKCVDVMRLKREEEIDGVVEELLSICRKGKLQ